MKVGIIARFEMSEADLERFVTAVQDVVPATHKEEGCELYAFSRDVLQPNVIWVSEQWASEEALNQHLLAPHIARFLSAIADIQYVSADVRKYDVETVGTVVPPSAQ